MKAHQFLESATAGATSSGSVASVSKGLGKVKKRSQSPGTNALDGDSLFGETAPKGWEGTVKAMKKHKEIDNPYALTNYMKNKGYKSHKKEGVAEGSGEAEAYKAHLIKTMPQMMNFLSKKVKGWTPGKEEMLGAIDTAYMVMKHTGDVKQAGKAMMDELNTLHRMSQGQQGVAEGFNGEYDDEAGMADNNLETLRRTVDGIDQVIDSGDNLPEWCQEKIAVAKSMLVAVWDYMQSEEERGAEVTEHKKGVRAMKHTTKPRNFVAKNAAATTSGAGAHKDKKKAVKQGETKHKNKEMTYESKLFSALDQRLKK